MRLLLLGVLLALSPLRAAETSLDSNTNIARLNPGSQESRVAQFVAILLERSHYSHKKFDDAVASKFLDRYFDAWDPQHLYFLQSDLDEFDRFRTTLDDLTLGTGETSPAYIIYQRFLIRFHQQIGVLDEFLKAGKFEFTGQEKYNPFRRDQPRPKDLVEARKLWTERIRYEYLQEKLNDAKPQDIVTTLTRRYARMSRAFSDFDNEDVFQIYLTALAHVYDPHSDYMGKSAMDSFNISMKLSLFGIGAVLRSEDGYCKIQELMPGPAMRSKQVKPNDKIIAVAQASQEPVDVVDMKLNKVVELIRGPKGSEVRLTIIPADAPDPSIRKVVTLIRDEIKLEDQEAKAKVFEAPDGTNNIRLGVIDLPSFYADLESRKEGTKSTTTDVARLIKKLKQENIAGLVLDLRRNGGGSLEEAIKLSGLFIKQGPIVQVRDPLGNIEIDEDDDPTVGYDGPLVVLTSRFSASASEILAGALQDYGRALIVGDSSTHGKGTVQSLIQLGPIMRQSGRAVTNNPGALKLTIRKFYRASGSSTQLEGVRPDLILPSVNNHAEVGEASLENALGWDTVPPAKFTKLNVVAPHVEALRKRSEARIAADKDYQYIREDIERYKKWTADKSVSLNEEQRRKEKKELTDRAEARKKELKTRPEPKEKVFELTLKDVDKPGLPRFSAAPKGGAEPQAAATPVKAAKDPDDLDDPAEEKLPAQDITLEEARRILLDLVNLVGKNPAVARSVGSN